MLPYKEFKDKNQRLLQQLTRQRSTALEQKYNEGNGNFLSNLLGVTLSAIALPLAAALGTETVVGSFRLVMVFAIVFLAYLYNIYAFIALVSMMFIYGLFKVYSNSVKEQKKKDKEIEVLDSEFAHKLLPVLLEEDRNQIKFILKTIYSQDRFKQYNFNDFFDRNILNFNCHYHFKVTNAKHQLNWYFLELDTEFLYASEYMAFEYPVNLDIEGNTLLIAKDLNLDEEVPKKIREQAFDLEEVYTEDLNLKQQFCCYSNKLSHAYASVNIQLQQILNYFSKIERNRMIISIKQNYVLVLIAILNRPFVDMHKQDVLSNASYQTFRRGQKIAKDLLTYLK